MGHIGTLASFVVVLFVFYLLIYLFLFIYIFYLYILFLPHLSLVAVSALARYWSDRESKHVTDLFLKEEEKHLRSRPKENFSKKRRFPRKAGFFVLLLLLLPGGVGVGDGGAVAADRLRSTRHEPLIVFQEKHLSQKKKTEEKPEE